MPRHAERLSVRLLATGCLFWRSVCLLVSPVSGMSRSSVGTEPRSGSAGQASRRVVRPSKPAFCFCFSSPVCVQPGSLGVVPVCASRSAQRVISQTCAESLSLQAPVLRRDMHVWLGESSHSSDNFGLLPVFTSPRTLLCAPPAWAPRAAWLAQGRLSLGCLCVAC